MGETTFDDIRAKGDMTVGDDLIITDDITLAKTSALILGTQANVTGSGHPLTASDAGAIRVFCDDGGVNIGDSVRGVQSRMLLTVDQSAGTIRALQGQLKMKDLADVTTGIYTAVQGYVEMAGTHIAKTGATWSCFDASTEIGTSLTIDSGGEYYGVHVETTGSGTITNNGTCAAIGITKASGAASWPIGLYVDYGSSTTPISVGKKANLKNSGITIPSTDDWGAVRVFTDDNGASIAQSVRAIQGRVLLTFDQTGGSIRAVQGQVKYLDGIDTTSGVYTAVQGYNEYAATHNVKTGAVTSCIDASTEIGTALTVDSGGRYAGIHVETTGSGTITDNGTCAGILIDKATGAASWPVGLQINCDSVTRGVQVGTLGSNITSGVPILNATSINGFYSDDNGADQTAGVYRNVTARTYFSVTQSVAAADYHVLRGHLKAASGINLGGDTSLRTAVNGHVEIAGATTVGAGSFLAAVEGEIWTDGNITATGKVAGVMSRCYTSGAATLGTYAAAFMATKQWASTDNWPVALYVDAADYMFYWPTGTNYECGIKITAITNVSTTASGVMKVRAGDTDYYIPLWAAAQLDGE